MDSSGTLVANGFISFLIFTCLLKKQPARYVLQNRYSATGAKNLKKPGQEFIFSKNLGCTNNENFYMYFIFVELFCQWLPSFNNKHTWAIDLTFLKLGFHQWELQIFHLMSLYWKCSNVTRTIRACVKELFFENSLTIMGFKQKGSIAYVWLVLATPLWWEQFSFLFYIFAAEILKQFAE